MAKPRMRSSYLRSEASFLIRSAVMAVADSPVYGRSATPPAHTDRFLSNCNRNLGL